jgi:hypothetical protein
MLFGGKGDTIESTEGRTILEADDMLYSVVRSYFFLFS